LDRSRKYCNSNSLPVENSLLLSTDAEKSRPLFQEKPKRRLDDLLDGRESVSFAPSVKPNEDILTSGSFQRNQEKRHKSFKCITPPDATSSHSFALTTPGARNILLTKLPSTKLSRRARKIENVITPPPQSVQPVISFSLSRRRNTNVNRNANIPAMFKPIPASLENKNMREESFPQITRKNFKYYSNHFFKPRISTERSGVFMSTRAVQNQMSRFIGVAGPVNIFKGWLSMSFARLFRKYERVR